MIAAPAGTLTEMVGAYMMEKIPGLELKPGMYSAFMVVNDSSDFVAGVVLNNYRKHDIDISCASETPAAWRPGVCKAVFTYVFEQLGCVRCTAVTVKGNRKARGFLESLGFQLEGNVRLGYDGVRDALVYGMLRSECRFLAEELPDDESEQVHGQEQPGTAAAARSGSDSERAEGHERSERSSAGEPEPHQSEHAAG